MPTNVDSDNGALEPAIALEELVAVAVNGSDDDLKALLLSRHPADVAELINVLDRPELRTKTFRAVRPDDGPRVLRLVSSDARKEIVQAGLPVKTSPIVEELDSDDAADLLGSVPKERGQAMLEGLPGALAARIQQLLRYPARHCRRPDAGGVRGGARRRNGRRGGRDRPHARGGVADIHNVFVVDHRFHLLGTLPFARLILARAERPWTP